jgi:hypothetical protein
MPDYESGGRGFESLRARISYLTSPRERPCTVSAKRFTIAGIAAAAVIVAIPSLASAAEKNLAGTWVITGTISNDEYREQINPKCAFKLDGEKLTGSCKSGSAMGAADGSVDGNTMVWHWDRIGTSDVTPDATLTFRGKVGDDGVLRGEFKDSNIGDTVGTFVGQILK